MVQKISGQRSEHALPTSNGGTEPYPIQWLDKNGSYNQTARPHLEPSHTYHFKGLVARPSTFSGVGTDHIGNASHSAARPPNFGLMQGEYWAGRTTQRGVFAHI
jgi:hypothetical protein